MRKFTLFLAVLLVCTLAFFLFDRKASLSKGPATKLDQNQRTLTVPELETRQEQSTVTKPPESDLSRSRIVLFPSPSTADDVTHSNVAHIKRTLELSQMIAKAKGHPATLAAIQESLVRCLPDSSLDAHQQATCMRLLLEIDPKLEDLHLAEMLPAGQELWLQFRAMTHPKGAAASSLPESLGRTEPGSP